MHQVSCSSPSHSTPIIFLILVFVGVKGVPLSSEPPRRHYQNGIPFHRTAESHVQDHRPLNPHQHQEFTVPHENLYPPPMSNFDEYKGQPSWDWGSDGIRRHKRGNQNLRNEQESWRYRPDSGSRQSYYSDFAQPRHRQNLYDDFVPHHGDNFNQIHHRRRREAPPDQWNDWPSSSHPSRVKSNSVRSNTRNPLPLQMTRPEIRESLDFPNANAFSTFSAENQHHHETREEEWKKFHEDEEEEWWNPRELFHHYHNDHQPRYYFEQDGSSAGGRSLNDGFNGFRDLDQQFEGQSRKSVFQSEGKKAEAVSSFPELSVVRFRSSSISLGDNLEIVRIELDISDGDENDETKLEEVEDQ